MTAAQWDVAVIDGKPQTVVNLPMVAEMVKASPLGREVALWRMRGCLSAEHFGRLRCLVAGVGDE